MALMIFLHFLFTAMQYLLLLFMSSLSLVVKVFVFYHLFQARESHRSGCDSFIHSFWRGTVLSLDVRDRNKLIGLHIVLHKTESEKREREKW